MIVLGLKNENNKSHPVLAQALFSPNLLKPCSPPSLYLSLSLALAPLVPLLEEGPGMRQVTYTVLQTSVLVTHSLEWLISHLSTQPQVLM